MSLTRAGYSCGLALLCFIIGSKSLQNAVAEGDTRTISMHHMHTGEDITITYKRNGQYDEAALEKLNWFLRDWRRSEQTRMDPHLIDLVWEVQRESGTNEPIQVVCGYRSPQTNAMLRHRSSGVARFSQHMLGHAMDYYIPGVPLEHLREIGLRLQRGGVGFYPESGSPFVHMDTGGVRMWPRMTHEELARVFPDGRTVQIPIDGKPLSGYALALADIRRHGDTSPSENSLEAARNAGINVDTQLASNERHSVNPFAKLLGLAKDDDEDDDATLTPAMATAPTAAPVTAAPKHLVLAAIEHGAQIGEQAAAAAEKATAKVAVKAADAAAKVKLIRTADASPLPPAMPAKPNNLSSAQANAQTSTAAKAAPTPNQIIVARGFWEGPADGTVVANPTVSNQWASAIRAHRAVASNVASVAADPASPNATLNATGPDATASIGPFPKPRDDHDAPAMALAYADQPVHDPVGIAALRAAALPAHPAIASTTIAVKRAAGQVASAVMMASTSAITVVKATDAHFTNPWLRAIVLSPSVHRFLTTVALGARDFRSLATMMVKPSNAVMMTFAAEPYPGLDHDRFSGPAIVFVSTVSYPMRTALLQ